MPYHIPKHIPDFDNVLVEIKKPYVLLLPNPNFSPLAPTLAMIPTLALTSTIDSIGPIQTD